MQFKDRSEAGRLLAQALEGRISSGAIVIAIPRGGVVIGHEIARRFGCPLGITIPRKVGALENPELAIGAVAEDGSSYVDSAAASVAGADQAYVDRAIEREKAEIDRRKSIYCAALGILDLSGRDIILVDDGIATGYTMLAAIRYLRKKKPSSITVAVPVAPADVAQEIIREADGIVCLYLPGLLRAIGEFYLDFGEVNDDTVVRLLGSGSNP
jgi:predicted phosphoribosyltransferase